MKTTIDIPEPLYKKAKIRAVERGQTLRQIVLTLLEQELEGNMAQESSSVPNWSNRKLSAEFARWDAADAFVPLPTDRNITELISDDRDGR